jgi:hypothetical protein
MVHSPAAWLAVLALALLGALSPARGHAGSLEPEAPAESSLAAEPRTFGTSAITSHTLQAFAFTGAAAADVASLAPFGPASRFCTSLCTLGAPLLLPAGARVTAVELDGCDTSAVGGFTLTLFRAGKFESGTSGLASTIFTGMPGCTAFTQTLPMPHTIDNASNSYFVQLALTGGTSAVRFQAVRVLYTLQVSPAPAVATFPNDVPPGHPFFQFVEALAQAGITAGCGPGAFCPDSPLTRGQMAVFLSKALGLHFAP